MYGALAAVVCVGLVCAAALRGWTQWLRHREREFEHKPLAELEARLSTLEGRVANSDLSKLRRA